MKHATDIVQRTCSRCRKTWLVKITPSPRKIMVGGRLAYVHTVDYVPVSWSSSAAPRKKKERIRNQFRWTPMDWVREYAAEFVADYGAKFVQEHHKHPGITVEMDTKVLVDFLVRRGDWRFGFPAVGQSLFEDYLTTLMVVENRDVRLYIRGIGKTNVIVPVDIDWLQSELKMRRRSRVKITPRKKK
jgi:hypothetical protein